jgi:hypothetical protein
MTFYFFRDMDIMNAKNHFLNCISSVEGLHQFDNVDEFKKLANVYIDLWKNEGIQVHLSHQNDFHIFKKSSIKRKQLAMTYLQFNIQVMKDMISSGISPSDSKRFTWNVLKKLKLHPKEENFLEFIHDEDIIEIYFLDDVQVFRNRKFFEISTLSIEDILCRPWYELVQRKSKYLFQMLKLTVLIKLRIIKQMTYWNIAKHEVVEKCTPQKTRFSMHLKYFFPLYSNDQIEAILTVNHTEILRPSK